LAQSSGFDVIRDIACQTRRQTGELGRVGHSAQHPEQGRLTGDQAGGPLRFPAYLRRCRQERHLSLRQVEKLSEVYPDRISNSYLAYCETGRLLPSLGKLMTLSKVLGIPLQSFTERMELDREVLPHLVPGEESNWAQVRQAGIAAADAGRLPAAFACFEKALALLNGDSLEAYVDLRLDIAVVLKRMSRHYTAREILEEVLSDKTISACRLERALLQLGGVLREMGKLPIAVMVAREALARAETMGDKPKEGHAASLLANSLYDLGCFEEAAPIYHRAVRAFRDLGDHSSLACNMANLGNCLVAQGHFTEGIRSLREAEALAESKGFTRQLADIGSYLGKAWQKQGSITRAERSFFASNAIARAGDYSDILFTNTWHLREIALKAERMTDAADHMRSLRYFRTRVDNTNSEIRAYDRLTNALDDDSRETSS